MVYDSVGQSFAFMKILVVILIPHINETMNLVLSLVFQKKKFPISILKTNFNFR